MKREGLEDNKVQQDTPGATQPVAENPNPRANENIRARDEHTGTENTETKDEIGTEITDEEDA